jgi:hypothetical protein
LSFIERFADRWYYDEMSYNQAVPWTLELIEKFESQWDWRALSNNPAVSLVSLTSQNIASVLEHHRDQVGLLDDLFDDESAQDEWTLDL